jgi:hypothetical protein
MTLSLAPVLLVLFFMSISSDILPSIQNTNIIFRIIDYFLVFFFIFFFNLMPLLTCPDSLFLLMISLPNFASRVRCLKSASIEVLYSLSRLSFICPTVVLDARLELLFYFSKFFILSKVLIIFTMFTLIL